MELNEWPIVQGITITYFGTLVAEAADLGGTQGLSGWSLPLRCGYVSLPLERDDTRSEEHRAHVAIAASAWGVYRMCIGSV